ncbi:hypothetical protein R3P38DRAFT_3206494 [Favolaschia claudopus]|uniref:Uncharacterized protein n=1 Tax=Favolaschia claudopus TaxID=2862362 RepID=A0AAW0ALG3_9AGAR
MAARSLRNGKIYADFIQGHEAIVIPGFRLSDMINRHATGPQEENDGASDNEDDGSDSEPREMEATHLPSAVRQPPIKKTPRKTPLVQAARQRWEAKIENSAPPMPSAPSLSKKDRKRARLRGNRAVKREVLGEVPGTPKAPKAVALKRMRESSPVPVSFSFSSHPGVASTGWMGVREPEADFEPEQRVYSFEEARALPGMQVYEWDETQGPLVDEDRYVIGVFAAHPRDADWDEEVAQKAAALMEEAGDGIYNRVFSGVYYGTRRTERKQTSKKTPPRGTYHARAYGNSMGGGQPFPQPFYQNVVNTIILVGLLAQTPFQRIAGFTNSIFQTYAPDLHAYYYSTMEKLHEWNTNLKRNFPSDMSVFAATTLNFDLQTLTFPHLDYANLAWGWCSITSLGNFDPDKGGHLILWDLKLIVRFPPGYTILIPSALIRHSNTSIQPNEKRFSFTQYTAAGIFRFVDNGFRSDVSVEARNMTDAERAERVEARKHRWVEGLKMYRRWPTESK